MRAYREQTLWFTEEPACFHKFRFGFAIAVELFEHLSFDEMRLGETWIEGEYCIDAGGVQVFPRLESLTGPEAPETTVSRYTSCGRSAPPPHTKRLA